MASAPILFLDIDGVCNTNDHCTKIDNRREEDGQFDPYDMVMSELVAIVQQVCERTGAKVVISSAWRRLFTLDELREGLRAKGLTAEIVGHTPTAIARSKISEHITRGREINEYLIDSGHSGPFAIVDDFDDMIHLKPRLVQTDSDVGITQADADRLVELLQKEQWS